MALKEKCGVFGVYGPADLEAARLAYYGLWALQHRGQESSGIASSDGKTIVDHVKSGLVAQAYQEEDLERLTGHVAIGHNRYSTSGGSHDQHGQPIINESCTMAFAHNGNLPSVLALESFLDEHEVSRDGLNDSAMMAAAINHYLEQGLSLPDAVQAAYPLFTGAFSCVAMTNDTLVAFRDAYGIRPLALGGLEDGYAVSSETCALDAVGAAYLREVAPGEMVIIDKKGLDQRQLAEGQQRLDIFEFVYFARPDSLLLGRRVNDVRMAMGKQLAKEHPIKADIVIPVPDSSIPMALGYAQALGLHFEHALIKNRYIHRTFIRPTQALRERDIKMKLNPLPESIMGRSVIVIDDSIVRGTTTSQIVAMLYGAGAKEVHLLSCSPPIKYPDFYGIDTPSQDELIAANMSIQQIRDHLGATSLGYLSYDGMIRATGRRAEVFSTACFNGDYPVDILERAEEVAGLKLAPVLPRRHIDSKRKAKVVD
jgi:amidophosphoribosyltransferase